MLHFFKNYDSQTPIEDYQIEVKTHSKKEIGFKLFKEAVCIDSTLIKGKIKRNYFDIKKENSTSSNRFPFWDWHTEKGSIQLIKADTLLINHYKSSANYILFIPVGGGNLWHSYSLKKIK